MTCVLTCINNCGPITLFIYLFFLMCLYVQLYVCPLKLNTNCHFVVQDNFGLVLGLDLIILTDKLQH